MGCYVGTFADRGEFNGRSDLLGSSMIMVIVPPGSWDS